MQAELNANFEEIHGIESRIKELNSELRGLRKRRKELLETLSNSLKESEEPGFVCDKSIIFFDNKTKRLAIKKKEKELAGLNFLKSKGISNVDSKFLEEFLESMRGKKIVLPELKIKQFGAT